MPRELLPAGVRAGGDRRDHVEQQPGGLAVRRRGLRQAARARGVVLGAGSPHRATRHQPRVRHTRWPQPPHVDRLRQARRPGPGGLLPEWYARHGWPGTVGADDGSAAGTVAVDRQPRLLTMMPPTPTSDTMTHMLTHIRIEPRAARRARIVASSVVALAAMAACDLNDALHVEAPSRIPADAFETPANAVLLVNSLIGDFECAYGAYTAAGALIGEESVDGIQTADRYPYDRRSTQPSDRRYSVNDCNNLGTYVPLQTARVSAENVLGLLERWTDAEVPNRAQLIATASAHAGYSLLMLGEGFCQAVISSFDENKEPVLGGIITRDSVLKLAEARFTAAITSADASIKNMALLGRAKARQDLGRLADARADAILVPANFARLITASATPARRQNKVWAEGNVNSRSSLAGAPYRSMTDPRVRFVRTTNTTVTGIPVVYQTKYPDASSP